MITYQYAMSDDGSTWNITDVSKEYRKKHHFECFSCHNRMIAKIKIGKKEPHFAHFYEGNCSRETYLHQLGKKLFVESFNKARRENKKLVVEYTQPL